MGVESGCERNFIFHDLIKKSDDVLIIMENTAPGNQETEIRIRTYSEDDSEHVTALMKDLCKLYNVEFDMERWKRSLEQKIAGSAYTRLFVAEVGSQVIGMLVADIRRQQEPVGYISNLIVDPEFRNKGVGENLINNALDFFRENHVSIAKVNIRAGTTSAERLFAKLGFSEYIIQMRREL